MYLVASVLPSICVLPLVFGLEVDHGVSKTGIVCQGHRSICGGHNAEEKKLYVNSVVRGDGMPLS